MAKNNLSPEQDVLTREFYVKVATDDSLFPSNPAQARQLRAVIISLLGYAIVQGKFVSPEKVNSRSYFSQADYEDEWMIDYKAALAALEGADEATENDTSEDEADSGESTEGSEVR